MDHDVPLPSFFPSQRETARSYNPIQGLLLVSRFTLTSTLTRTIRYKQLFGDLDCVASTFIVESHLLLN